MSGFNISHLCKEARYIAESYGKSFAREKRKEFIEPGDSEDYVASMLSQINMMEESEVEKEYISYFNSNNDITKLLHDVMKDKPYFNPIINPDDFNRVLCVRAKLNNYRIMRQQGCFLIFGMNETKSKPAYLNNKWKKLVDNKYRIIIPKENKESILQGLRTFAISKQTLFPELDMQAQDIMDKYKS